MPVEDTLEVWVTSINDFDKKVYIDLDCAFDEAIPTGCSEYPRLEPTVGSFSVILDLENKLAYLI